MKFPRLSIPLLFLASFASGPVAVGAATFTVNSTVDQTDAVPGDGVCASAGGSCTLRAAIQEANAVPGTDKVVLGSRKYFLAIAGASEDAAATGDLDITDSVIIKGVGAARTIVNGGALDRVFHVIGPVTVRLAGLSIQNGSVTGSGGGIYNQGGAVTLASCSVANNVASGNTPHWGGGAFSAGGTLELAGSSVVNNAVISDSADVGGGGVAVINDGTLSFAASRIAYNSASSPGHASGGGIMSRGGRWVAVADSRVLGNSALSLSLNSYGGGLSLEDDGARAVIARTAISMNSSTSSGGNAWGGGLYLMSETATVSACTIRENRASAPVGSGFGGGIAARFTELAISSKSAIRKNLATLDGGGTLNSGSTITVSPDSSIADNMPNNRSQP